MESTVGLSRTKTIAFATPEKRTQNGQNCIKLQNINLLETWNPLTGTLANSEHPDKMPHNVAFYQGLHFLLKDKIDLVRKKYNIYFGNYNLWPLKIYNGPSWLFCM